MKSLFKVVSQTDPVTINTQNGTTQKTTIVLQEFGGKYENSYVASLLGNQAKFYSNVNLACSFQQVEEIENDQCLNGVFSKTAEGFRFEEAAKGHRDKRNPKLFDGNYCSLVHMQNGRYQIHMKTINASAITDPTDFAFKVYSELLNAFKIID